MPRYDVCLVCGTAWAGCTPDLRPPFYCNDACVEKAGLLGYVGEQLASKFPGSYAIGTVTITKHYEQRQYQGRIAFLVRYEFSPLMLFTPGEQLQHATGGMDTPPRACP